MREKLWVLRRTRKAAFTTGRGTSFSAAGLGELDSHKQSKAASLTRLHASSRLADFFPIGAVH
jgi:hypothetical protein